MSILTITKKLIENRLKTLSPSLPIAWENVKFIPPDNGDAYLKYTFSILNPDDSVIGGDYYRENILFSVYVLDKLNIGTGNSLSISENIRSLFAKKTTLEDSGIRIQILETPRIAGSVPTEDRLVTPINIKLTVENLL